MNRHGVSAVVGVVLMVAITVAIAATVYVYVSEYLIEYRESPDGLVGSHWVNGTGVLRGLKEVDCYDLTVGNFTFRSVGGITDHDVTVLSPMFGHEISYHLWWYQPARTFTLEEVYLTTGDS